MAAISRACAQNWHRDWKTPPETTPERLASLCRRQAARCGRQGRRRAHPSGQHVELCRRRASSETAQADAWALAGAAALGAVAELARRANRAAAAGVRFRHAAARHRHLRAGEAVFLAVDEHAHRAEGTGGIGRRAQSLDPREEASRFPARHPARQSLAGARDDRSLPGFRHREFLARAGREDERAAGRPVGRPRRRRGAKSRITMPPSPAARS